MPRTPTEHSFTADDGTEIFYRAWPGPNTPRRAVMFFHRGHEHSGRWQATVDALTLPDDTIAFAWDQRGHGKSPGDRGSAEHVAAIAKDADVWARHLEKTHGVPTTDTVVVAHSVGGVVATAWLHDYAPPVRGIVLATAAFAVKLYIPLAVQGLRLKQKILGPGYVKSYVKSKMLTHDKAEAAAYDADPLVFKQIAVKLLLDLHDTSRRLVADAGTITTPTLLLAAGKDWVVKTSTQRKFYERLGATTKQMEVFPEMGHAVFHEVGREKVIARVKEFIDGCFAAPPRGNADALADRGGATRTEYDRLRAKGSPHWRGVRLGMKTVGRLSSGVRLGWQYGFDSGRTLDYVYANAAAGTSPLGKLIDKNYLASPGWAGIRTRRTHVERLLNKAIDALRVDGRPVHVVDIASGPGRYVIETLAARKDVPVSALLRDYQDTNVQAARGLASSLGLDNIQAQLADAFDPATYADLAPRPTIAMICGLLELFPDNAPARAAFANVAGVLDPGSFLIYTGQPWHPQMEFIARVLTNREGQPWIMRRRSQAELDALVREAGFEKVDQLIDPQGIFTVSLAVRRG